MPLGVPIADMLFYGLLLVLPLSALIARRPPVGRTLKMVLAWIGIFVVGLVVLSQRDRLPGMNALLRDQQVVGSETRIRMAEDGHFWADVTIDGVSRRMLIDSGATITAISTGTAAAAGIDRRESMFPTILNTANGQISARVATASTVSVGNVVAKDLSVVVSPAFGETDVVGMNFLSRLASWRVEGNTLILTPSRS